MQNMTSFLHNICRCAGVCMPASAFGLHTYPRKHRRPDGRTKYSPQAPVGALCGVIPIFLLAPFWIFPKVFTMSVYCFGTRDK